MNKSNSQLRFERKKPKNRIVSLARLHEVNNIFQIGCQLGASNMCDAYSGALYNIVISFDSNTARTYTRAPCSYARACKYKLKYLLDELTRVHVAQFFRFFFFHFQFHFFTALKRDLAASFYIVNKQD